LIRHVNDMAFRKYQRVEKEEVLSPEQHQQVEDQLHQLGKTSATELDAEEREGLEINDEDDSLAI